MSPDVQGRRLLAIIFACLASLAITWADYATGNVSDLFVFYYVPVAVATWYAGAWAALFVALISTAGWLWADLSGPHPSWLMEGWEMLMRLASFLVIMVGGLRIRKDLQRERALNQELSDALQEIKQLTGILPMCSFCRRIRDESDQWIALEQYIQTHTDAKVSHGLCPHCYRKHYGQPDGT